MLERKKTYGETIMIDRVQTLFAYTLISLIYWFGCLLHAAFGSAFTIHLVKTSALSPVMIGILAIIFAGALLFGIMAQKFFSDGLQKLRSN